MPRAVGFDRDAVVTAARTLFWREGYDASVPELERVTGLARSSIYNTFGSKRGLFDAAVQSYLDDVIRPRLRPLQSAHVAADAIATYLSGLRAAFLAVDSMAASSGCLLINTAGTPMAQDEQVARVIAAYRDEMHDALARGVSAQRPARSEEDQRRLSDTVAGLVIAAFALARITPHYAAQNITTALELLDSE